MVFLILHRLNDDIVCLNKDSVTVVEQEKGRTSIKCDGLYYLVKEPIEQVMIQCDQLLESRQQIRRVVEGEIKPAVPYEYKELKEKKPRKKKQLLGELGYESK